MINILKNSRVGFIDPLWNIDDYRKLNYKLDFHKDRVLIEKYIESGHSRNHIVLYNYFEPNPMPESINYIKNNFDFLSNISVAINLFKPGQYLPYHRDLYEKFKSFHDIDRSSQIIRCIVMLEDWKPGQIMEIEKEVYSNWKAGDIFKWEDSEFHSFYNLSMHDRFAVQVTGISKEL